MKDEAEMSAPMLGSQRGTQRAWQDTIDRLKEAGDWEAAAALWDARTEIESLKEAIRRLAEQDATLSVCNGNVTVTMEGTLTDEERRAIRSGIEACEDITYGGEWDQPAADTLKALLERLG